MANAVLFLNVAPKSVVSDSHCNKKLFDTVGRNVITICLMRNTYLILLVIFLMSFLTQEILLGWVNFEARTGCLGTDILKMVHSSALCAACIWHRLASHM